MQHFFARHRYQLRVQLQGTHPVVWRRIAVGGHTTLEQLHHIVQAAMGWPPLAPRPAPCARYWFEIAGQHYGVPNPDWPEDATMDARRYRLGQLLQGQTLAVRYVRLQSGATWVHRIKLEACTAAAPAPDHTDLPVDRLPVCLGGRHLCPALEAPPVVSSWVQSTQPQAAALLQVPAPTPLPEAFDVRAAQARLQAVAPTLLKGHRATPAASA